MHKEIFQKIQAFINVQVCLQLFSRMVQFPLIKFRQDSFKINPKIKFKINLIYIYIYIYNLGMLKNEDSYLFPKKILQKQRALYFE